MIRRTVDDFEMALDHGNFALFELDRFVTKLCVIQILNAEIAYTRCSLHETKTRILAYA